MEYEIDESLAESFSTEEKEGLTKIFNKYDEDKDGFLNRKEMINIINALDINELDNENFDDFLYFINHLGYTNLKKEDVDEKGIPLIEFLKIMKQIKLKDGSIHLSSFIRDIEKVEIKKGNEEISKSPEKLAYIKFINSILSNDPIIKGYLPIDPVSNEIFEKIKDGLIFCKLINKIEEGKIDERSINKNPNEYQKRQNLNLAISTAKVLGLKCGEITSEIIIEQSNCPLIINFLGDICIFLLIHNIGIKKFPELANILNKNEQISELLKLSPEKILLKWFNFHLKENKYEKQINNFLGDISEEYIILLYQLNKEVCDKSALNESDPKKRAENVLSNLEKLKINSYITADDIIAGNEKLNLFLIASIFNSKTGLKTVTNKQKKEINDILTDQDAGEEKIFRVWINSLNIKNEKNEEISIQNLYEESKDGVLLLRVIDKLQPGIVKKKLIQKKPKNVFEQNVNCNEIIDLCKKLHLTVVGTGGGEIREGNKKHILSIVRQMMKMHSLQVIGNKKEEDLVNWGNEKVDENNKIKNLKDKKLGNSLYFINIIKSIEPNVVNLDSIIQDKDDKESKESNAKICISIVRKLGATVFLEWKDIVQIKSNLLIIFLASIYEVAQNHEKKE